MLQTAVPRPSVVHDEAAILALALHCLMVESGFTLTDKLASPRQSSYNPPPGWSPPHASEWIFHYTKVGLAGSFCLHCSIQRATMRMYIRASEDDNEKNLQVLGLQVSNYVAPLASVDGNSWEGVITQEAVLRQWISEYITVPLTSNAIHIPLEEMLSPPPEQEGPYLTPVSWGIPLGLAAVAVVVGGLCFYHAHRSK